MRFKLVSLLLIAIIAIASLPPPAAGQVADSAGGSNILFGGVRYTKAVSSGDKAVISGGVGFHMTKGLYTFAITDVGQYNSFDFNAAYLFNLSGDFWAGLIAGPNATWVDNPTEPAADPVTYIAGSSGGILAYKIVWVYGKYNFAVKPEDQTYYQDGFSIGAGLYKLF